MSSSTGPVTSAWRRDLAGRGWAVGALLTPGAAHALVDEVAAIQDRTVPAKGAVRLLDDVTATMGSAQPPAVRHTAAARLVEEWLVAGLGAEVAADPEADQALRLVLTADGDPRLLRLDELAERMSMSARTVQRLARSHVGMSPAAMIRRRRLQAAAERVSQDPDTHLASIAADLGYADHAHLTREFHRILGFTPTRYRDVSR